MKNGAYSKYISHDFGYFFSIFRFMFDRAVCTFQEKAGGALREQMCGKYLGISLHHRPPGPSRGVCKIQN
jgi:hypothetical protein